MSYVSLDTTESRSHLEYMEKLTVDKYQQTKTTMAIISQETWDNMPEEEKEKLCQNYSEDYDAETRVILEDIFGKENLQPKPKIKTWKDVEKAKDSHKSMVAYLLNFSNDIKLNKKLAATFQIKLLIELGYGGMVSDEEWKDLDIDKYCITYHPTCENEKYRFEISVDSEGSAELATEKKFIAFHTKQQAEEFMSYPENRALVEQYYMI